MAKSKRDRIKEASKRLTTPGSFDALLGKQSEQRAAMKEPSILHISPEKKVAIPKSNIPKTGTLRPTLRDVEKWEKERDIDNLSRLLTTIFVPSDEVIQEAANALSRLGEQGILRRVLKSWTSSNKQQSAATRALA